MCNSKCKGLCHDLNDGICQQYCVKDISTENISIEYMKQNAKVVSMNGDVVAIISHDKANDLLNKK